MNKILILDFGSQYSHLIVRRCRECNVYSELLPFSSTIEKIKEFNPGGIILSGGPASVYEENAPHLDKHFWDFVNELSIPLLGVCYGMQEIINFFGGKVEPASKKEFGHANLILPDNKDILFNNVNNQSRVWMSHGDKVTKINNNFNVIASSPNCGIAGIKYNNNNIWGLQFHPEVTHTDCGKTIIENFIYDICKIKKGEWNIKKFTNYEIEQIKLKVKNKRVIGALSGGVDSTVAAALVQRAIGDQFHGFMINTGLLRINETEDVLNRLKRFLPDLNIEIIDKSQIFFNKLKGISDPEKKRKIMGELFIDSFLEAVNNLKLNYPIGTFDNAFLLQGTLYPDVIESYSLKGPSHTIKTHHNVGGLPSIMKLELLEPLRELFKDEVRLMGEALGLDDESIWRHPFPGPGLAIRIIGEVTEERVKILQQADNIYIEELKISNQYEKIGQAFAVLLPDCRSVGVMGDQRTYGMTVVLRAIETSDFMTGDWYDMPNSVLKKCSTRIINEVKDVNRVCYDISSKPPATIEWEKLKKKKKKIFYVKRLIIL